MTDIKTDGNDLNTMSDRAILLQILHEIRHLDAMVHDLHRTTQELAPHARKLIEARARVGKILGSKRERD